MGLAVKQSNKNLFKGRQFTAEIILWAVRWYLQFPISYRDLERMFADCGAKLRQVKFLNNIVEQDHRRIKRLVRPGLGFKSVTSAAQTLSGYEAMAMIRKGQIIGVPPKDMGAQRDFIATLFSPVA